MSKQDTYKAADGHKMRPSCTGEKLHGSKDILFAKCGTWVKDQDPVPAATVEHVCKTCLKLGAIVKVEEVDEPETTWRKCTREEAEEYRCWSAWSNNWTEWYSMTLHLDTSVKYEYRTSKPAPKQFAPNATPEELGKLVREVWIQWAGEQSNPKDSWLVPWECLPEPDKDVDRRIGLAVYAKAQARIAELEKELEQAKAQLDEWKKEAVHLKFPWTEEYGE